MVFPTVVWGESRATFMPTDAEAPSGETVAALVFAREAGQFVLADIAGRGWCIPGGRLEPGESAEQAARREAWEEAGVTLGALHLLGHFVLSDAAAPVTDVLPDGSQSASLPTREMPTEDSTEISLPHVRLVPTYRADVVNRSAPPASESRGVRLVRYEDIPNCYYAWDDLLAAMFAYAEEIDSRREKPEPQ